MVVSHNKDKIRHPWRKVEDVCLKTRRSPVTKVVFQRLSYPSLCKFGYGFESLQCLKRRCILVTFELILTCTDVQNLFISYLFLFIFIFNSKLAASRGGSVMISNFNELGLNIFHQI